MKSICCSLFLLLTATSTAIASNYAPMTFSEAAKCEPSTTCRQCHSDIYQQYNESAHATAFSNPLFWTQYFREVVPRATSDKSFEPVARKCVFCHSPVLYMSFTGLITRPEQAFFAETGVTCDFCHIFSGYAPNGEYLLDTSGKKQGPFKTDAWHSQESSFIKTSDFCASCHNASNHLGADVRTTYDEWSKSRYAVDSLTCQECHMNIHGYLKNGKAEFEAGRMAKIKVDSSLFKTEAEILLSPEREKLYTHLFQSLSNAIGAIKLDLRQGKARLPDGRVILDVKIDNRGTGHKLPSGSSDLRLVWLEITASLPDGRRFYGNLLGTRKDAGVDYGVSGVSPLDEAILGSTVPKGSRVYRTIFVDSKGRRVKSFVDAYKIIFDNRIEAEEIRHEKYTLPIPADYSGTVTVTVTMNYIGAPPSFTQRLGIPDFKPIKVNSITKEIELDGTAKEEKD